MLNFDYALAHRVVHFIESILLGRDYGIDEIGGDAAVAVAAAFSAMAARAFALAAPAATTAASAATVASKTSSAAALATPMTSSRAAKKSSPASKKSSPAAATAALAALTIAKASATAALAATTAALAAKAAMTTAATASIALATSTMASVAAMAAMAATEKDANVGGGGVDTDDAVGEDGVVGGASTSTHPVETGASALTLTRKGREVGSGNGLVLSVTATQMPVTPLVVVGGDPSKPDESGKTEDGKVNINSNA